MDSSTKRDEHPEIEADQGAEGWDVPSQASAGPHEVQNLKQEGSWNAANDGSSLSINKKRKGRNKRRTDDVGDARLLLHELLLGRDHRLRQPAVRGMEQHTIDEQEAAAKECCMLEYTRHVRMSSTAGQPIATLAERTIGFTRHSYGQGEDTGDVDRSNGTHPGSGQRYMCRPRDSACCVDTEGAQGERKDEHGA